MSYTIEYARQFIKSDSGITPCWLAGDNNVTELTFKGRERRTRDWCVFHNLLGVTEEEILESVKDSLGRYDQHWMKNGKWITDAGLIRWIKSGVSYAASIEDICAVNNMRAIRCYASVWSKDYKNTRELDRWVSTTVEFDAWVAECQMLQVVCAKDGRRMYPVVDFGTEKLRHPTHPNPDKPRPEKVILRRGRGRGARYLVEHKEGSSTWTGDVKKALVFNYADAELAKEFGDSWMKASELVDAKIQDAPYNVVLRFIDGSRVGAYVQRRTRGTLYITPSLEYALKYKDVATAKAALNKIQPRFAHVGRLAVVTID